MQVRSCQAIGARANAASACRLVPRLLLLSPPGVSNCDEMSLPVSLKECVKLGTRSMFVRRGIEDSAGAGRFAEHVKDRSGLVPPVFALKFRVAHGRMLH